jgi:hypothetical protein
MRMNADPERDDALLDAMLGDESWQAASATFKAEALRTFHVRQRVRRLTRWAGSMAVLAAAIAVTAQWIGRPRAVPRQVMLANIQVPKAPEKPRGLTDAELLAAFPKGSCFIAEVDGQKQLVFFDRELEHRYVAGRQ